MTEQGRADEARGNREYNVFTYYWTEDEKTIFWRVRDGEVYWSINAATRNAERLHGYSRVHPDILHRPRAHKGR